MLVQSVSSNYSAWSYNQNNEGTPCWQNLLVNPFSLIGRVCNHWREIALVAATAISVGGFVMSFLSGSVFLSICFAIIAGICSIAAGEMRDLGTLHDVAEDLKDTNNDLRLNNKRFEHNVDNLNGQVTALSGEVINLTNSNTEYSKQNTEYLNQNEQHKLVNKTQKDLNDEIALKLSASNESFENIKTKTLEIIDTISTKGGEWTNVAQQLQNELAKSQQIYTQIQETLKGNFSEVSTKVKEDLSEFLKTNITKEKMQFVNELNDNIRKLQEDHFKKSQDLEKSITSKQVEAEKQIALLKQEQEFLSHKKDELSTQTEEIRRQIEALKRQQQSLKSTVNAATAVLSTRTGGITPSSSLTQINFEPTATS